MRSPPTLAAPQQFHDSVRRAEHVVDKPELSTGTAHRDQTTRVIQALVGRADGARTNLSVLFLFRLFLGWVLTYNPAAI